MRLILFAVQKVGASSKDRPILRSFLWKFRYQPILEGLSNKINMHLVTLTYTLLYTNGIYFSITTKARANILSKQPIFARMCIRYDTQSTPGTLCNLVPVLTQDVKEVYLLE